MPKVYYDLRSEAVSLPPGADENQAIQILKAAGIAPAGIRVRVVNKGQVAASEVKVGASTDGSFLYARTNPAVTSKSVWVQISLDAFSAGDKEAVIVLKDLVPEKPVVIDLGYKPPMSRFTETVVAAGLLAEKVPDIDLVPRWSLWKAIELPLQVLLSGLAISILVGVVLAARRNPRLREKLVSLLEAIFPPLGRIVRILID